MENMFLEKVLQMGSDHAGFRLKQYLKQALEKEKYQIMDHGTFSDESCDYPDYAHLTAIAVIENTGRGILICGSGNGVCMTANKHSKIRAALCWNKEIARLARAHNDANIICIPARFVSENEALEMVRIFLTTPFEGGRHEQRINKIAKG